MRYLTFAVAVVLLSARPALVQQPAEPWANKLFMSKVEHDFGNVAAGAQLKYSYPFKNIYNVPLQITNIRVSCGCTKATPSKNVFQPNEEGTLDVVMDGRLFQGPKSVAIYATVGPEYVSTAVLTVKANSRQDVVINPGEVNFGVVSQGQQPEVHVDVKYAGFLDWKVTEVVKPADAPFSVTMQETGRKLPSGKQAGSVSYRMTVKLAPNAPGGALKHELVLKTNDRASETLIVGVTGNVQETLRVEPSQVNFGALKLGELKTYKVQVLGNQPFRITDIKADAADVSADLPQQAAKVHILTIRCQPQALGDLRRTLTIITDLNRSSSVTVSIQASAGQ